MMGPRRGSGPVGFGQGHPELNAVEQVGVRNRGVFRVADGVAGGHQPELTGIDDLVAAQAVTVVHRPFEQPTDGLQSQVRMGRNLHARLIGNVVGAVVVYEAPRADQASTKVGQQPPHGHIRAQPHLAAGEQFMCRAGSHRAASPA